LSQLSMLDLFRLETESQVQVLTAGLLQLESQPAAGEPLEACMRAAHSLKGAARIVGLSAIVGLAHAMEDCFVAAQRRALSLGQDSIDLLLRGVDLLTRAGAPGGKPEPWTGDGPAELKELCSALQALQQGPPSAVTAAPAAAPEPGEAAQRAPAAAETDTRAEASGGPDRMLRVTAGHLDRLMGLAGESLVESRWLKPFAGSLLRLKRSHYHAGRALDRLRDALPEVALNEHARSCLAEAQLQVLECRKLLTERLGELELYDSRTASLAGRLYAKALDCRMRPFADGMHGFPRMVRDLCRALGKQGQFELRGEATPVDRDILENLDAPLGHLIRNAIDHGLETPERRLAAGKPATGTILLEARHSAGTLQITVADDGHGIDPERLRRAVIERKLASEEVAAALSDAELYEFLFLPGFSMKGEVTQISGRGVGLDAVREMVRRVRGQVRVGSEPGRGTRFQLQLPLTLSVVRTLLVDVAGEPYAFPLAYIARTVRLARDQVKALEGRQFFDLDAQPVSLVSARQVLEIEQAAAEEPELSVIVLEEYGKAYGLVVDRFLGERELVVQPLDPRLGKIKDIAAGAVAEDGSPVLIVDVEDLVRSIDRLVAAGRVNRLHDASVQRRQVRKRVLVVDDSLTVRELERKLLHNHGFDVEVSVDGMDGWNALRGGSFDLLVTDVDMPRMDGVQLVEAVRRDPRLKDLPVMIVSYKDREEDRRRGLEAGADYYLAKSGFHDETLVQAVVDLIGEATA
jgi:two-component system sensor histidine kinase and response regulator WspE